MRKIAFTYSSHLAWVVPVRAALYMRPASGGQRAKRQTVSLCTPMARWTASGEGGPSLYGIALSTTEEQDGYILGQ